jgi:hypothetical protein
MSHELGKKVQRLLDRLDGMVAKGRITEVEAAAVRAADTPAAFDAAVASIRTRHAAPHLDAAVEDGSLTESEAAGYRARLARGEHPRGLRRHRRSAP